MAELGAGELRGAYLDRKQAIRDKAESKRQQAKGKIELARIKAVEAKEVADLESAMYGAQIAAQNARKHAKQLRHQAGHYTPRERLGQASRGATGIGVRFVKGLMTPDTARRTSRKTTKRHGK